MGGRQEARWGPKWCSIFASMALLGLVGTTQGGKTVSETGPGTETSGANINNCNNHATESKASTKRNYLIVSTMDGKVSALNLEKEGALEWAVDVGAMPLLSSSISDLVMTKNAVPTRLIPSLDGTLFQFDAENEIIEALPFTADTLLSSSFKLNYDSTIVGGKESATYGVEVRTGKIRYVCNSDGCTKYEAEAMTDTEDVLVLTRHTKTVRAVEMRTGLEKWNFSVGQHEVSLVSTKEDTVRHLTAGEPRLEEEDDSTLFPCPPDGEEEDDDWFEYLRASMFADEEPAISDIDLKVIVPNGLVIALSKSDPGRKLWDYKFDTAIANAWLLESNELSEISLFNDKVVPALMDEDVADKKPPGIIPEPLVYIGMHEKQYYVQPSVRLQEEVHDTMVKASANSVVPSMPRIRWHPYIATAPSRTPIVAGHSPLQIGYDAENESRDDHGLAITQDQYPYENDNGPRDMGWYLMSDTSPIQMAPLVTNNRTSLYTNLTISLWNWKEVIAISLLMSVLVHLVIVKLCPRRYYMSDVSSSSTAQSTSEKVTTPEDVPPSTAILTNGVQHAVTAVPPPEYISRFATEFELKTCLGRGGFGVVFEGLNRMDDCAYAIKRITLNNSARARQKVMREVKALAKLEHTGIVRYYQAWFENPPAGWQEQRDTVILDMPSTTPSHTDAQTNSVFPSTNLRSDPKLNGSENHEEQKPKKHSLFGGGDADNPLKMSGGLDHWGNSNISLTDSRPTEEERNKPVKGSEGFIPRLHGGILDESGSYSFGLSNQQNFIGDSVSFDIEFQNSETGSKIGSKVNHSESSDMPFQKYHNRQLSAGASDMNDSFNIVFEDSGCGLKGLNEEPSIENSINNDTQDTRCTDVDIALSHSHSPTKHSSPPRSIRPGTLPLGAHGDGARAIVDTDSYVDPRAPKLYLYIQMQLCRQDSLKDWLNCNTLRRDRRELLDIFDQIVCAVDYIHDNGLMHRDLKPSNIFFSLDGTVKVGDFGLVTTQDEEQITPATHTPQHAVHTGQVGTRLYMSPEQVAGHSYNQKVDIFSLGLIFFELFYPFATQMERINTLLAARSGTLPPRFMRELPDEYVFVKSLLDANPERRPSTKEIQQNLLLRDFEAARQTISRVRPRTRTTSSSGSGNSLSSSH